MDILRSSNEWLEGVRKAYLSNSIVYSRSPISLTLSATFGDSDFQEQDSDNVITDTRTRDFIVTAADFSPTFDKPKEGDKITVEEVGGILTFEVKSPAGVDVYENDNYLLSYRIHAQLIDQESCL